MATVRAQTKPVGLGVGFVIAFALAGCGGQANGRSDKADDVGGAGSATTVGVAGIGGSTSDSTPGSDDQAPPTVTGVTEATAGVAIGGAGGSASVAECLDGDLFASAEVSDSDGIAKTGTNGKARVTVTMLEEQSPSQLGAPEELLTRRYVLHGATQDWTLSATIPGLTSELIKVGDVVDFQLETSRGVVPLSQSLDQVFGIFNVEGELLLFGSHTRGYAPVPDLSFVGLDVQDGGAACRRGGLGCQYSARNAHFSVPGADLELRPGQTGKLGSLLIGVQAFEVVSYNNGAGGTGNSGSCDDSGRSLMVGVRTATGTD